MKTLFTIFILFIAIVVNAQQWPIDKETSKIVFTEVIKVDSVPQSELYQRAADWFASAFVDSKNVTRIDDKQNGKIIGKGGIKTYVKQAMGTFDFGIVNFDISIVVKDGKYKYTINNLYHDGRNTKANATGGFIENEKPACGWLMFQKDWIKIKQTTYDKINDMIISLKTAMNKPSISNENW